MDDTELINSDMDNDYTYFHEQESYYSTYTYVESKSLFDICSDMNLYEDNNNDIEIRY